MPELLYIDYTKFTSFPKIERQILIKIIHTDDICLVKQIQVLHILKNGKTYKARWRLLLQKK
jgi:hypothetical protein